MYQYESIHSSLEPKLWSAQGINFLQPESDAYIFFFYFLQPESDFSHRCWKLTNPTRQSRTAAEYFSGLG